MNEIRKHPGINSTCGIFMWKNSPLYFFSVTVIFSGKTYIFLPLIYISLGIIGPIKHLFTEIYINISNLKTETKNMPRVRKERRRFKECVMDNMLFSVDADNHIVWHSTPPLYSVFQEYLEMYNLQHDSIFQQALVSLTMSKPNEVKDDMNEENIHFDDDIDDDIDPVDFYDVDDFVL